MTAVIALFVGVLAGFFIGSWMTDSAYREQLSKLGRKK